MSLVLVRGLFHDISLKHETKPTVRALNPPLDVNENVINCNSLIIIKTNTGLSPYAPTCWGGSFLCPSWSLRSDTHTHTHQITLASITQSHSRMFVHFCTWRVGIYLKSCRQRRKKETETLTKTCSRWRERCKNMKYDAGVFTGKVPLNSQNIIWYLVVNY